MERKITLVAFMMVTIFSIGLTSTLVYGGNQVQVPVFDDNFVHIGFLVPPDLVASGDPVFFESFSSSGLQLIDGFGISPDLEPGRMRCSTLIPGFNFCEFDVSNFIDDLTTKIMEIHITFTGEPPILQPSVLCFDITGVTNGVLVSGTLGPDPDQFTWVMECSPNPASETISITREPLTTMTFVEIWTTSFGEPIPIGGTNIPIDQSALLLAGVQSISMWMIPVVIAGIGIGVFVIKRRK